MALNAEVPEAIYHPVTRRSVIAGSLGLFVIWCLHLVIAWYLREPVAVIPTTCLIVLLAPLVVARVWRQRHSRRHAWLNGFDVQAEITGKKTWLNGPTHEIWIRYRVGEVPIRSTARIPWPAFRRLAVGDRLTVRVALERPKLWVADWEAIARGDAARDLSRPTSD